MAATLKEWKDATLCVITADGRILVGTLVGHDPVQNLVLTNAVERVYSDDADVELVPLGLYVVRGDNVVVIGEVHAMSDTLRTSQTIPPIEQHQF